MLAIAALNVATNLAYLGAAFVCFTRRLYNPFAWFATVFLTSSLYHACSGFDWCLDQSVHSWQLLDHIVAQIAVSRAFLVIVNYDIVKQSQIRSLRIRPSGSSSYQSRATPRDHKLVLVKTRFADLASAIYTTIVIFASVTLFDTIYENAVIIGAGLLIVIINYVWNWNIKRMGIRKRFIWPAMIIALLLATTAGVLFTMHEPIQSYLHPVWHLVGAYSAVLLILGSTGHLKIFSVWNLLKSPA